MAKNHFWRGILVFWKMVPERTLKLLLQAWQFHRPTSFFSFFLATSWLLQRGHWGLPCQRTVSKWSKQACWSGKRSKTSIKFIRAPYQALEILSSL